MSTQLRRRLTQVLFFCISGQWLFMGIFRCPYGVPFVSCGSCPLGDCSGRILHLPFWGLALALTLFFRRAFCGWVCPLGYVQDAIRALRPSAWSVRPSPNVDKRARMFAYAMLAFVLWCLVSAGMSSARPYPYVVRSPSMWNIESIAIAAGMGAHRYGVRIVLVTIGLVGAVAVPRFWCRYLCPLGAVFSCAEKALPKKKSLCGRSCDACGCCGQP